MKAFASLGSLVAGLVAGLLLGYLIGIAMAPTEGERARARLREEARAVGAQPRGLADKARARIETAVEEGRRAAAEKSRELMTEVGLDRDKETLPARDLPV